MINPRQSLVQAICDFRYNVIASYLDEDYIHSDLTKAVFMEKLEKMFQWIEGWEGEGSIITALEDVDLREYANKHNYFDPVFFKVNDYYLQLA